jgi:hypothetical protein
MKTSTFSSIALVSILAISSAAFAQGRAGAPAGAAQGAASTAGTQSRIHTPGTGLSTGTTPLQTRTQTPITGPSATPGTGPVGSANGSKGNNGSNGSRGIHTPGTGLTADAPVPVPALAGK